MALNDTIETSDVLGGRLKPDDFATVGRAIQWAAGECDSSLARDRFQA